MAGVLALDHRRSLDDADVGQLADGHLGAGGRGHENAAQFFRRVAQFAAVAQIDRVALQSLHGLGDVHAADGGHDNVLDIAHGKPVAGRSIAI